MPNLNGQRLVERPSNRFAMADQINCIVGTAPQIIPKPDGATMLVLKTDQGGFRVRTGATFLMWDEMSGALAPIMPATEYPAASVIDGSGGWHLGQNDSISLRGVDMVSVQGYSADSVLTYFWI